MRLAKVEKYFEISCRFQCLIRVDEPIFTSD